MGDEGLLDDLMSRKTPVGAPCATLIMGRDVVLGTVATDLSRARAESAIVKGRGNGRV
jgi:hypothetical protein